MYLEPLKYSNFILRIIESNFSKKNLSKNVSNKIINANKLESLMKFKKKIGHRSEISGSGRYPRKAAAEILKIVKDAEGNASYKGLNPEKMIIKHIAAKKGRIIQGITPRAYGRATAKNTETVNVEIIIEEPWEEGMEVKETKEKKTKEKKTKEKKTKKETEAKAK